MPLAHNSSPARSSIGGTAVSSTQNAMPRTVRSPGRRRDRGRQPPTGECRGQPMREEQPAQIGAHVYCCTLRERPLFLKRGRRPIGGPDRKHTREAGPQRGSTPRAYPTTSEHATVVYTLPGPAACMIRACYPLQAAFVHRLPARRGTSAPGPVRGLL